MNKTQLITLSFQRIAYKNIDPNFDFISIFKTLIEDNITIKSICYI